MFRKSKALIICLIAVIVFSFLDPIESNAATNYDYSSPHSEPTTDDYSGYINIVTDSGLSTFAWRITPATNDDSSYVNTDSLMNITIINGGIKFTPQTDGYAFMSIWGLYSDGSASVYFNEQINRTTDKILYVGNVYAYSFYGNYGKIVDEQNTSSLKNTVSVTWSTEQSIISSIISVYHAVVDMNNNLGGTLDDIEMLIRQYIYVHLHSVDYKLGELYDLIVENYPDFQEKLDSIISDLGLMIEEQKETNSWLEKIFDLLDKQPEEEKNAAQSQANQSSSDAQASIEDKSAGFIDSVNGLASSMSYSGTQCAWTFPSLYLPEIPGVMSRTQLTSEKPIDFAYWVNQIPSDILLLVRSVLTIALIGFCFKEFYTVIEYVLTMRGGGNSE